MTVTACVACGAVGSEARCGACGSARSAGEFETEGVLATTARGRTYRARGPDGTKVALKELTFATAPAEVELRAFDREGAMLTSLRHPSIPRFVASFADGHGADTRLYLAQELIEGQSLADKLERHRFTEAECLDVARQVLPTLEYLQSQDPPVVHRDVKPANLIVRPDGSFALVDFGAARAVAGGATSRATLVGTFGYLPPEQLAGVIGPTTDVYAVGATLAHLLTRRPPAELWTPGKGLDVGQVSLGPRTAAFVAKLVALDSEDRFPSARDARIALDDPSWQGRRGARSRVVLGLACMLVATAVSLGVYGAQVRSLARSVMASQANAKATPGASRDAPHVSVVGVLSGNYRERDKWSRLRVDRRFPGAFAFSTEWVGERQRCTRHFDLVVDDVYMGPESEKPQRFVVDATFLKGEEVVPLDPGCKGGLDAMTYVQPIDDHHGYKFSNGRAHLGRAFSTGARSAWDFTAHPHGLYEAQDVRIAFGSPESRAENVLVVALSGSKITVEKQALLHKSFSASFDDVSAEWEARHADESLYLLRKTARANLPAGEIPKTKEELVRVLCPRLKEAVATSSPWPPDDVLFMLACQSRGESDR